MEARNGTVDPVFARNPGEAAALGKRHMLIVGAGSVGSAVAMMAVRAGVGRLTLVDPESLSIENVGRHMLSRESVDQPKVRGVKRAVKGVNPAAEVRAFAADFGKLERTELLSPIRPDIIVGTTDSFACSSAINVFSLEEGIPAVYVSCWGAARVGEILYVVPGKTPCYECVLGFRRNTTPTLADDPRKYTDPDFDTTKVPAQPGLWSSILQIAALGVQVSLGLLLPESPMTKHFLDCDRTLLLLNVCDFEGSLQPLAVTAARPERGCTVCDPSKLSELGRNLPPLVEAA